MLANTEGRGHHPHRRIEFHINYKLFVHLILTFIITLGALIGLLYLTSFIPKEALAENLLETTEYLEANEDEFYCYIEGDQRTEVDNYADTILFNIMYSVDENNRFVSLMESRFYSDNVNSDYPMILILQELIQENKEPDVVYDRYWHGMQVILRPLFVFFNFMQIRGILLVLLIVLLFLLTLLLVKKKQRSLALALWIGAVLTAFPMAAFCIEFLDSWLIMFFISMLCIKYFRKDEAVYRLMVISGVCCGFFDFLTTETLTVVLPLAVVFCLREQERLLKSFKQGFFLLAAGGSCWGMGYAFTWICKWTIASLIAGENRFGAALAMASYRQGADVTSYLEHTYLQPIEALAQNVKLFTGFPSDVKNTTALFVVCGICAALGCFVFLYRKSGEACILPLLLVLLALVPIARIMVLNSHSYQHCYMTYRALFGTICCVVTAVLKVVDPTLYPITALNSRCKHRNIGI